MENQIFKKIGWKKDGRPFGWGASPDADWKTIFLSTIVLILLASAWSFYVFTQVGRGEVSVDEAVTGEQLVTFDIEELKSAVSYYEAKAKAFEQLRNGSTTTVSDPSI